MSGRLVLCLLVLLRAGPAAAQVTITDATDEGIACFKIVTPTATYLYDKAGAGFTSILDTSGTDWINFHPQGTAGVANGQSGWYRGIPNMGLNVFGHPGYTGATSTTADVKGASLAQVSVKSQKGGWSVTWDFHPAFALLTVQSVAESYWLLYEGTPGGAVGSDDYCYRSDGTKSQLDASWEGDVKNTSGAAAGTEWVYFADGKLDRSLFMIHDDDSITDRYYLMDPMTVFGFGRQAANTNRLLSKTPATLIIGFVESRDYATVKGLLDAIHTAANAPASNLPALRDGVDEKVRDERQGQAAESDVKGAIKSYRNAK